MIVRNRVRTRIGEPREHFPRKIIILAALVFAALC